MAENIAKGIENLVNGTATAGRSAQESIRNGFSLLADGVSDLRKFDIVVNLGADQKNPGNTLLYVGKDGSGDIKRMDDKALNAQQPSATPRIGSVSVLSVGGVKDAQDAAAREGAKLVMKNLDILPRDGSARFPFNPEKPETAKAENLGDIKSVLWNMRGDLLRVSAPDYNFDDEGRVDGVKYKDTKGVNSRVEEIGKAIEKIETAERRSVYAKDLRSDLKSDAALFTPDQVTSLNKALGDSRTSEDKLNEAAKPPMTKI